MASHNETGKLGESIATDYMANKGYEILERNYRYGRFEVDIIAKKANFLVFVEVKTKTNISFGHPYEEVSDKKASQVSEAAMEYVYSTGWRQEIRFDIISIIINGASHRLEHIEDAF